ncbi:MAG: AAA family ATPase [Actinomycetia bacterium]|nr:AAA family ATPase [Actinomycetes bacterium]
MEAKVQADGSVLVQALDESLRFNTALWQESSSAENAGQILGFGIDAQGDLAEAYDPERVEALLQAVSAVLPYARPGYPEGIVESWPARQPPASVRNAEPTLGLFEGAVLYLSNRSSHYLLRDLEDIADDPAPFLGGGADRPFRLLLSEPSGEPRPRLESRRIDEVGFPFLSNPAQRQVVDAVEKNSLVVVSGPPGTGKSLTIANLVADLVTQGKSVLVTSHKNQALSIVRDKLNETELDFLYASFLGELREAKRELQAQIANVQAFAGAADQKRLAKQLAEIEQRRAKNGVEYAAVRQEFLARAQPEQIEAAGLYFSFEGHALLPVDDPALDPSEHEAAAADLQLIDALAREHADVWEELLAAGLASRDDLDEVAALLERFLDSQDARVEALAGEEVGALASGWHPVFDAAPEEIDTVQVTLDALIQRLVPSLLEVLGQADWSDLRLSSIALVESPTLREDCRQQLARLDALFERARELADARDQVTADSRRRGEVQFHHDALASLLKRRGARKWLVDNAPGSAALTPECVTRWREFWDAWSALRTLTSGLAEGLKETIPEGYEPDAVARLTLRERRALGLADALEEANQLVGRSRAELPLNDLVTSDRSGDVHDVVRTWGTALAAAAADRQGNGTDRTSGTRSVARTARAHRRPYRCGGCGWGAETPRPSARSRARGSGSPA